MTIPQPRTSERARCDSHSLDNTLSNTVSLIQDLNEIKKLYKSYRTISNLIDNVQTKLYLSFRVLANINDCCSDELALMHERYLSMPEREILVVKNGLQGVTRDIHSICARLNVSKHSCAKSRWSEIISDMQLGEQVRSSSTKAQQEPHRTLSLRQCLFKLQRGMRKVYFSSLVKKKVQFCDDSLLFYLSNLHAFLSQIHGTIEPFGLKIVPVPSQSLSTGSRNVSRKTLAELPNSMSVVSVAL